MSKGSLEEPAFLDPFWLKGRVDAFEVWRKLGKYLVFAHFEKRVVHLAVVAEIDEVPPAIFCR